MDYDPNVNKVVGWWFWGCWIGFSLLLVGIPGFACAWQTHWIREWMIRHGVVLITTPTFLVMASLVTWWWLRATRMEREWRARLRADTYAYRRAQRDLYELPG